MDINARAVSQTAKTEKLLEEQNKLLSAILTQVQQINQKLPEGFPSIGDFKAIMEKGGI